MKALRPIPLSTPSNFLHSHLRSATPSLTRARLHQPQFPSTSSSSPTFRQQTRTFLPNPFASSSSAPTTISITRTLPYPKEPLYSIISNVGSYSSFVPFCVRSIVTALSNPDNTGQTWPAKATLVVGWREISESFDSRVYCVPGRVVEAVSGLSNTSLPAEEIRHYKGVEDGGGKVQGATNGEGVFEHLVTRWTVKELKDNDEGGRAGVQRSDSDPGDQSGQVIEQQEGKAETEVRLDIEYKFVNPVYGIMSEAVKDRIAGIMIDAFEKRVREVLGHGGRGWGVEIGEKRK